LKAIDHVLKTGAADLVSMARPLIRDPHLVRRWREGDRKKAKCISCNRCFHAAMSPEGVYCVMERQIQRRKKAKVK
jgi:2,4-dienoyl-CoA reductase-like NADH-dependent reductase (Old Yellow Enzyme family)